MKERFILLIHLLKIQQNMSDDYVFIKAILH